MLGLFACNKTTDYPIGPGGGGGGGGTGGRVDGRGPDVPAAIDAALIKGRVCLAADPRQLTVCAASGAGGLTVRLAMASTITNADGTFTIVGNAAAPGQIWSVTGPNIVSSFRVFSDYQIPALATATFDALKSDNGVVLSPGQGSIIAQLVHNGAGAAGKIATSSPTAAYAPYYDGTTATTWQQSATSTNGVVWIPGLNVGTATVTAGTPPAPPSGAVTTPSQPVYDGAITFVTIAFP